jgi:tripartite motif-containing protein 71
VHPNNSDVLVIESGSDRVEVYNSTGTLLKYIGGTGSGDGQLKRPVGVAFSPDGAHIAVGDNGNLRVQVFSYPGGAFERAFGAPAVAVWCIAADPATGELYIGDYSPLMAMRKFSTAGVLLRSWPAGGLFGTSANSIAIGGGHIYAAFAHDDSITKLSVAGDVEDEWSGWYTPTAIALAKNGNLLVVDALGCKVYQLSVDTGAVVGTAWPAGGCGSGADQLDFPEGVAVDPVTGDVFVADTQNARIVKFTAAGERILAWGTQGSGPGQLNWPVDVQIAPSGEVVVADTQNQRVQVFTPSGSLIGGWDLGADFPPLRLAFGPNGALYVTSALESRKNEVLRFTFGRHTLV